MSERAKTQIVAPATRLQGAFDVPGDKSITIRALLLGAVAQGCTLVTNLAPGRTTEAAIKCLQALGVTVRRNELSLEIDGLAESQLASPAAALDCGGSATTMRLLAGLLAGQPLTAKLTGNAQLSARPMERIACPLRTMGAGVETTEGHAPLTITGKRPLDALQYKSPVASAQLKSAVLLAGLSATGRSAVAEPAASRDHTERLLRVFGVDVVSGEDGVGFTGPAELTAACVDIPGDFSAAAPFLVAAAGLPGSRLVLRQVNVNLTRTGLLDVLAGMGVQVHRGNEDTLGFEEVADLFIVGPDQLKPFVVEGARIPRLIDELPLLAVLAMRAHGTSIIRNAEELRHKETDRLASTAYVLRSLGAKIEETGDGFIIEGPQVLRGGAVPACGDHRLAMAAAVAGLFATGAVTIEGASVVAESYPGFFTTLASAAACGEV